MSASLAAPILDIASPWRGNPTAPEPSELGLPRRLKLLAMSTCSGAAGARRAERTGKRSLPAVPWNEGLGTSVSDD